MRKLPRLRLTSLLALVSLAIAACSSEDQDVLTSAPSGTSGTSGAAGAGNGAVGGTSGSNGNAGSNAGASTAASAGNGGSSGVSGAGGGGTQGSAGTLAGAAGSASGGAGTAGSPPSGDCTPPPTLAFDPLVGFVSPPLVATVTVTSASDSGPGSLREAIAGASEGAVIGISPSLTNATLSLLSTLELSKSVTFDGSGAPGFTVDGGDAVGLVHFNGDQAATLTFLSLRFAHGHADGSGGAISLNGAHLTVEIGGCSFDHNASTMGGAVRVGYAGDSTTWVHDSVFTDNDGSVPNSGDNGFSGGAMSSIGTQLHVSRCRFENNKGPTSGALYEIHANPVVEDCVFVGNSATSDSGSGAYFTDGGGGGDYNTTDLPPGEITLRRCWFENNQGKGTNGGAALLYAYPKDTVTVEDTVFKGNGANPGKGGAIFLHADKVVNISRTAFVNNQAQAQGGAIWGDGSGTMTFENVLFSGNQVQDDRGGALNLNVSESAMLAFSHVTFVDNTAGSGVEALWLPGTRNVTMRNSIVANPVIAHSWEGQINFDITDEGGNLEWPDPGGQRRSLTMSTLTDPMLEALSSTDGTEIRALATASPAVGAAVAPFATRDQRGAMRDAAPDSGSFEASASCNP